MLHAQLSPYLKHSVAYQPVHQSELVREAVKDYMFKWQYVGSPSCVRPVLTSVRWLQAGEYMEAVTALGPMGVPALPPPPSLDNTTCLSPIALLYVFPINVLWAPETLCPLSSVISRKLACRPCWTSNLLSFITRLVIWFSSEQRSVLTRVRLKKCVERPVALKPVLFLAYV